MPGAGNADGYRWERYLADFHAERPAVTERLLGLSDGRPYSWLAEPLCPSPGPVLDLGCGSAPTRAELPAVRWVGVDASGSELACAAAAGRRPLVRADAAALPLADRSVAAVCAAMSLQVLTPLDTVLREVERVLRPGGTMAALVPASPFPPTRGLLGWARVLYSLRTPRLSWPNPQACEGAARLLRSRGWTVLSDERRVLRLSVSDPDRASLLVRALYLPDTGAGRLEAAERALASWARPGRLLPLPLRRVVARLPEAP
ncbi:MULTISPECIES: class I SAM-dependent methyltransferase [unclassified Nocardiopsis]|uniref:class I SAM-dependent methyltransferase n=1 Tax=unclassified Nocardiopsis TaxID=2649073 RepID=UPI001358E0FB|nr:MULTISPECIES: class I SAM-dependent methyltransferase [unclassified Nocardiopsis]